MFHKLLFCEWFLQSYSDPNLWNEWCWPHRSMFGVAHWSVSLVGDIGTVNCHHESNCLSLRSFVGLWPSHEHHLFPVGGGEMWKALQSSPHSGRVKGRGKGYIAPGFLLWGGANLYSWTSSPVMPQSPCPWCGAWCRRSGGLFRTECLSHN